MRRDDVKVGMILYAWKSIWGEYLIEVIEVTTQRPARVSGKVIKIIKTAYGSRANVPMLGKTINVGVISVKRPTEQQLGFEGL